MRFSVVVLGAFVVGGTLGVLAATPWQDAKAKEKPAAAHGEGGAFSPEEMKRFQDSMTPGPKHAEMSRLVGTWEVQSKFWMKPGEPPQQGSGTSELKMLHGGRYLSEEFSGTCPMGTFHGTGLQAWNNAAKQWEHVWFDDMGTGLMFSHGEDQDGGITLTSEHTCPITGQPVTSRTVVKQVGADERTVEMWSTYPGQPEFQTMSMHYQRLGTGSRNLPNSK
jgi:hypothetical protein